MSDNGFHNNGLDSEHEDLGRAEVTGDDSDIGKFRTPSLRNIALTAPYMHDDRFQTLEEVIEFYSAGLQMSDTIDPLMKSAPDGGLAFTKQEKSELLAFLNALTDETAITNPEFGPPD